MPRLNRFGDVLAGIAGASTRINGVEISPNRCCGGWHWLYQRKAAGQVCTPDEVCNLQTEDGSVFLNEGAYYFAAGGGRWMSFLSRFRSNFLNDDEYAGMVPLWIDLDGNAAIVMDYQGGGNIRVVLSSGEVRNYGVTVVGPLFNVRIGDGLLTARTANGYRIFDTIADREITNALPFDADFMHACRAGDKVIVFERLTVDASLRIRFADQTSGITLAEYGGIGQETHNPAVVTMNDGRIRAAWSHDQADVQTVTRDVNVENIPGASATTPVSVYVANGGNIQLAPAPIAEAVTRAVEGIDAEMVIIVLGIAFAVYLALEYV